MEDPDMNNDNGEDNNMGEPDPEVNPEEGQEPEQNNPASGDAQQDVFQDDDDFLTADHVHGLITLSHC